MARRIWEPAAHSRRVVGRCRPGPQGETGCPNARACVSPPRTGCSVPCSSPVPSSVSSATGSIRTPATSPPLPPCRRSRPMARGSPSHLAIIVAILLVVGGFVGMTEDLSTTPGRALARLGLSAALIGGAVVTISLAIDGFSMKAPSVAAVGTCRTGRGRRHAGRRRRQQRRLRHLEHRHARLLRGGLRLLRGRRRRESAATRRGSAGSPSSGRSDPGSRPSSGSAPASRRSRPRPCSSSRP